MDNKERIANLEMRVADLERRLNVVERNTVNPHPTGYLPGQLPNLDYPQWLSPRPTIVPSPTTSPFWPSEIICAVDALTRN